MQSLRLFFLLVVASALALRPLVAQEAVDDAEAASLRKQVAYLTRALAAARAEADVLRARLERREMAEFKGSAADTDLSARVMEGGLRVLDVNRDLRMLVVNAGARHGLRSGMAFMAVREDRTLARVVVVDVRTDVAGAVVEDLETGAYPMPGDRLVMLVGSE